MQRAGQTPHGARPNREEVPLVRSVPASCVADLRNQRDACRLGAPQPPGRSLEPGSNARPRGMTVLLESSGRQNSAYRSGCLLFLNLAKEFGLEPFPVSIIPRTRSCSAWTNGA